jgi:hypothetical protein
MTPDFSQLVWLGANTASEPVGLLNQVTHATLFEAREAACKTLQKKFPQRNITIKQTVLTAANTIVNFTEYNLAEFSAIQPATGLKKLFPGLKKTNGKQLSSTAVSDAISSLKLNDSNNLLIVDIADSSLALLTAIEESNQLHCFSAIYVKTASEPLYSGAPAGKEIVKFLNAKGYILQHTLDDDPDLPWLSFRLNPLWSTLQQADNQILSIKQQNTEYLSLIKSLEEKAEENSKRARELDALQIDSLSKELQRKSVQLKEQQNQLNELLLAKKTIELENRRCMEKLKSCTEQLSRADTQYQLIKDLILSIEHEE